MNLSKTNNPDISIVLKRIFDANRETVFEAWTNPDFLKQWFKGSPKWTVPFVRAETNVSGKYRVDMLSDTGDLHPHFGKYKEFMKPSRLVFTWNSEWSDGETIVTVEFRSQGESTEVTLIHEKFSSKEARDDHEQGWPELFAQLDTFLGAKK